MVSFKIQIAKEYQGIAKIGCWFINKNFDRNPVKDKIMNDSAIINHPVLPLRDIVVFPHMIVRLFVGREKSVRALEEVMKDDKEPAVPLSKNRDNGLVQVES